MSPSPSERDFDRFSLRSRYLTLMFGGEDLGTGTGFLTASQAGPLLFTARHNFTGRDHFSGRLICSSAPPPNSVRITHLSSHRGLIELVHTVEPLFDQNGEPLWIEHPTLHERADLAALPLRSVEGIRVEGLTYDPVNTGQRFLRGPGTSVSVIGFPFGLPKDGVLALWATGHVASEPMLDFDGLPVFLIDCRTRPGHSGSPVIAYRSFGSHGTEGGGGVHIAGGTGRFLGLYTGRVHPESDLGYVWKVEAIAETIREAEAQRFRETGELG